MKFKLRIPAGRVKEYQERYNYEVEQSLEKFRGIAKRQGHLTAGQLYEICKWKSRRRAKLAQQNDPSLVKELTAFAFRASHQAARIGSLTLLEGVHYPTASVILHFCVDSSYPILDFRALWSLGIKKPSAYTAKFWTEYVQVCREVAKEHGVTVRELDMALWQYSKRKSRKKATK